MKKFIILFSAFLLLANSCVVEPTRSFYIFEFFNKTNSNLTLNYKTIVDSCETSSILLANASIKVCVVENTNLNKYKDGIISHFFEKLTIMIDSTQITKNLYDTNNWNNNDSIVKVQKDKVVELKYNFTIYPVDLFKK